jgi:hypothetical protein
MRDAEAGGESARAGEDDGAFAFDAHGHGQAVRDDEEARRHGGNGSLETALGVEVSKPPLGMEVSQRLLLGGELLVIRDRGDA